MEVISQLGHFIDQERPVCMHRISGEHADALLWNARFDVRKNFLFDVFESMRGTEACLGKPTLSMLLLTPFSHSIKYVLVCSDDELNTVVYELKFAVGDEDSNFEYPIRFRVEASHFAVDPNERTVCKGQTLWE